MRPHPPRPHAPRSLDAHRCIGYRNPTASMAARREIEVSWQSSICTLSPSLSPADDIPPLPTTECVRGFISLKYGSGCRGTVLAARDAAPRGVEPVVRDAPIPLILAPQARPCARSRCINAGPYTDATARGDGVRKGARVYMCRKILVSVSSLSLSLGLSLAHLSL
jgi:hypothetical protein